MKDKNLLILTTYFSSNETDINDVFVRAQVNKIAPFFNNIYVISPISIFRFIREYKKYKNGKRKENNLIIFYPLYLNFPFPILRDQILIRKLWLKNYLKTILKVIRKNNISFDIIHAHYTWPPGAVAVELKKDFNVPVVITEHTSITLHKASKRKDPYYFKAWKESDAIIRVNKKDVPLFKKYNKNTVNIPNGFDEKKFYRMDKDKCREKLNLPQDRKIILTIGNLVEIKGHKYLIEAMKEIVKKRRNILCLVIGSGNLKKMLENQIEELKLKEFVKLLGGKPHNEISIWMNACDLFVLPSLNESFGVVQIEAMACGKPVVATKNGGSEEIITSKDYGLLCEPANPEDLAEKILIGLDKKWDRNKILNYSKKFMWSEIAKEIIDVYKRVLR